MEKAKDKKNTVTVEASKVKEENFEAAGGRCRKGFWQNWLNVAGGK